MKVPLARFNRNAKRVATKVIRIVRNNRRLAPTDDWAAEWLIDGSRELPEHIAQLARKCNAINTPRTMVIYYLLRKLHDNVQAVHVLIALGLFEDYAVAFRRFIEITGTLLYVMGFSKFHEYASGELVKHHVTPMLRKLPLQFNVHAEALYKYLSKAVHPKGGEIGVNTLEAQVPGAESDIELAKTVHNLASTLQKSQLSIVDQLIEPIVELYLSAEENGATRYERDRITVFCHLFQDQQILEELYLFKNYSTGMTRSLEDVVNDQAVAAIVRTYPQIASDLFSLFIKLTFAVRMSQFTLADS